MQERVTYRVSSIDILRGLVMIIMALDHTRDFFHVTAITGDPLDIATTTVPLFFTRWITHFCAPTFVFLSGTSAYLASRNKTPANASRFLIKRGIWLILAEMVVLTLGITFNPLYNLIIWQVIWVIGWSMIILGILIRFSFAAVLVTALVLFLGHNLFDYVNVPGKGGAGYLLKVLFTANAFVMPVSGSYFVLVLYAILPWSGVMLLGYTVGYWFTKEFDPLKRKRLLLTSGLMLILLFIILRFINMYGDPAPWDRIHFLSFLKASKYPPSLLYLCMTLGPALVSLACLENVHNKLTSIFAIYGRVPFFYYVLHFYMLHTLLVVLFFATGHSTSQIVDQQVPFLFRPANFGFSLTIVYVIWLSVVAILYQPCRWFHRYKMTHSQWWLKYI